MLTRTYIVKMPSEVPTAALDILVQSAPGSQDDPALPGDGAYYEWRGRPLRLETLVSAGAAGGFVPRLRLGLLVTITPIVAAVAADVPGVQLSASLASLASTDSGPSIAVPAFADPAGEPAIRLVGSSATSGLFYVVTLMCPEAHEDIAPRKGG